MMPIEYKILIGSLLVFIVNLPFGIWRASVKKKSRNWFLAIHIPVPLVVGIRFLMGIGFVWFSYPAFIAAFFFGQLAGGMMQKKWNLMK